MEKAYEEAFAEVDEILKMMPIDLLSKIPAKFRQVISENKSKDYIVNIQEPLEEEQLKEETIVILGLIYRDFLASPEEREELQLRDAEELKRIEQEMQEKYDILNIFEKRKNNKIEDNEQNSTDLIIYKEQRFIRRLIDLIKGFFKRK